VGNGEGISLSSRDHEICRNVDNSPRLGGTKLNLTHFKCLDSRTYLVRLSYSGVESFASGFRENARFKWFFVFAAGTKNRFLAKNWGSIKILYVLKTF